MELSPSEIGLASYEEHKISTTEALAYPFSEPS